MKWITLVFILSSIMMLGACAEEAGTTATSTTASTARADGFALS
jgi:uncharacterized lipoprotein YajG